MLNQEFYTNELQQKIDSKGNIHDVVLPIRCTLPKVKRNGKCICGSGLKYKKCCMPIAEEIRSTGYYNKEEEIIYYEDNEDDVVYTQELEIEEIGKEIAEPNKTVGV